MAYVLLWIENLAVSLLLVATVLAVAGRWSNPWLRAALWMPVALVPLAAYTALTVLTVMVGEMTPPPLNVVIRSQWFYWMLPLTLLYIAGVVALRLVGFARTSETATSLKAAGWPRTRLLGTLLLVFAIHLMTFWNLDLSIQQRLAGLRAEAGALALSAAPARLPDSENAALQYQRAFEVMEPNGAWPNLVRKWINRKNPDEEAFDADDPELRQFLRRMGPAMTLLRRAAEKPGCYFDRDWGRPTIGTLLPYLHQLHSAAKLLALNARVQAADGDFRAALADVDTIFRMAEHAASEPLLVGMLTAKEIDRTAIATLQAVAAGEPISARDLDEVDLSDSLSYRTLFERSMRMGEAFGVSVFADFSAGRVNMAELCGSSQPSWVSRPGGSARVSAVYRLFLLTDDIAAYQRVMRQTRQLTSKAYHETREEWDAIAREPSGPLTSLLLPVPAAAASAAAAGDARRHIVQVAVAALRYRAREGRFPETAVALVPEFLLYVPKDPFDGSPIRIKPTDRGLVVYSVGPNTVDDQGTAADNVTQGDIIITLADFASE